MPNGKRQVDQPSAGLIHQPGMLLIGSGGRNSGKTEFATRLIRRFARERPIVGIKVTAVRQKHGPCPRGGKGCGVCSALEGEYCITAETDPHSGKDTSRLLAAGADRVFWLRVLTAHLTEGLAALLDLIGPGALTICESNSLRTVVRPGIFLMVRDKDAAPYKASAEAVKDLADRIVHSDGEQFDLNLDHIVVRDDRWILKEHATAIVMAGGSSARMGRDKSLLAVHGGTMIEHVCAQLRDHFDEVLVSANDANKYGFLGLRIVPDRVPGQGPLMGLSSALAVSAHDLNFAVACDIPAIDISLVHRLLDRAAGCEAVVPRIGGALLEPLFAVYRKSALRTMDELLADGERRIRRLFNRCRTRYVDLRNPNALENLNTMQEYEAYVDATDAAL